MTSHHGRRARRLALLTAAALLAAILGACAQESSPDEFVADERKPYSELYEAFSALTDRGWTLDVIIESRPQGTTAALPIIALRSPVEGEAAWFLAGIHGEEPAGPNALFTVLDDIALLGERYPVVLMPLLNPQGYVRNWRYLNTPVYSESVEAQSVGDSSHLLVDPAAPGTARADAASSPEAAAITAYVLQTMSTYPPRYSIDLHEDNMLQRGYVYSQGELGAADPLAHEAVDALKSSGIPLQLDGETRFGEQIENGIIGPVTDSSIDELMSARQVVVEGAIESGPAAATVLVFETPSAAASFDNRVTAHVELLRRLIDKIGTVSTPESRPE